MILIACEESQTVTQEFRKAGYDAISCDLLPTSGSDYEHHLEMDVSPLLSLTWDAIIAFPPCTHLATSGAVWFPQKIADGRQQKGIDFFMAFVNADAPYKAIENPVGIMSTIYRKPDQIVNPFQFGDAYKKRTCLWLFNLPKLIPTDIVDTPPDYTSQSGKVFSKWCYDTFCTSAKERAKLRSKTPKGLARAMAEQWGPVINDSY